MCVGTARNYSSLLINKTQEARSQRTNAVRDVQQCSSPRGSTKYFFSELQLSSLCNAVWLKWRMQPCYLSKAVRHPYPHYPPSTQKLYYHKNQEKKRKNSIKRRKESTSMWILIRYNAVHYVDLRSSFLIAKKCTCLHNSPKTQSSHFLIVAPIHWTSHEKRGDDVPDFQRTNRASS